MCKRYSSVETRPSHSVAMGLLLYLAGRLVKARPHGLNGQSRPYRAGQIELLDNNGIHQIMCLWYHITCIFLGGEGQFSFPCKIFIFLHNFFAARVACKIVKWFAPPPLKSPMVHPTLPPKNSNGLPHHHPLKCLNCLPITVGPFQMSHFSHVKLSFQPF